jgi:hypothetical protein
LAAADHNLGEHPAAVIQRLGCQRRFWIKMAALRVEVSAAQPPGARSWRLTQGDAPDVASLSCLTIETVSFVACRLCLGVASQRRQGRGLPL